MIKIIIYGNILVDKTKRQNKKKLGGNNMKNTRELRTIYANQESFNKKAFVKEDEDGTQYLYSYYSLVVTNFRRDLLV